MIRPERTRNHDFGIGTSLKKDIRRIRLGRWQSQVTTSAEGLICNCGIEELLNEGISPIPYLELILAEIDSYQIRLAGQREWFRCVKSKVILSFSLALGLRFLMVGDLKFVDTVDLVLMFLATGGAILVSLASFKVFLDDWCQGSDFQLWLETLFGKNVDHTDWQTILDDFSTEELTTGASYRERRVEYSRNIARKLDLDCDRKLLNWQNQIGLVELAIAWPLLILVNFIPILELLRNLVNPLN